MIDKSLNYGRHLIHKFIQKSVPYRAVLDIGAGHGDDLMFAKEIAPSAHLYAIENYPPYIKELESKGVKVYPADIERDQLPFPAESIDVVIINQVFEHVKEVFWILNEISRVLKVGGHLIIGVPNLASMHNRLLLVLGKQPTCIQNNSAHLRGYTKNDFKKLLNSGFPGGYTLAGFGGSNFYPFPSTIAKPLAILLPTMAWGIFMHWKKEKRYKEGDFLRFVEEKQLETNFFLGKARQATE
jgi:SAM-dependent methyltransferase